MCAPTLKTHTHTHSGWTHSNDVKEVIVSQSVQYGGHRLPGDGQPEAFHASAHVHQDDHVLRRGGRLDVPLPVPAVKGYDAVFIRLPFDSFKKENLSHINAASLQKLHGRKCNKILLNVYNDQDLKSVTMVKVADLKIKLPPIWL